MKRDFILPDIGEGIVECEVIEWKVKVGDLITEEDSLITVESDKASMDIPAPESGLVKSIEIKVGDVVKEGSLILSIDSHPKESQKESVSEEENQATQKIEAQPLTKKEGSD